MFSCSHVRYCFQVFSFFESLSFSANFLSFLQTTFVHVQGAPEAWKGQVPTKTPFHRL